MSALLARLSANESGLTSKEAAARVQTFGPNVLVKRKKRTATAIFLSYFKSPLVIILVLAGFVTAFFREVVNAAIIFTVVIISIILGYYQEFKAENAAELLRARVRTTTAVLRNGVKTEVQISEIVPGDIIQLSAGDLVPADCKIMGAKDFFVDQSALTGESYPVEKTAAYTKCGYSNVTELPDCVFLGTSVVSGTATALVVRTGDQTEYGKIAKKLAGRMPETEFERGLRRFGYLIMQVTFLLVILVFFVNALYRRGVLESLLFSVALAVGLTPELLPMIVTVNLSKGAMAMSKKGVIVKRLAAIQNFGSMDVLCTDKTGTLTENRITLVRHVDPEGNEDEKVLLYSFLNSHYQTGLRSPLDEAILRHKVIDTRSYAKVDEIPFDFNRRRVSIVLERDGQRFLISKGAPEQVLEVCSYCEIHGAIIDLTDRTGTRIEEKYREFSAEGYRVLGVAYKKLREHKPIYSVQDESEMIFFGLVVFTDPPKMTTRKSISLLKHANVELKILTGDNELVTRQVCQQLVFDVKGVLLGPEISQMTDETLGRNVEAANIFARVTPSQKDRIIMALRKNGHVVGYLGDGINDAASLRTSDVGISVNNAADVAKESADIVLLRKDLTVLQQGVLEGRKTFSNTMKYVMMGTSSNFGNMFSAAGASLFLSFLPMLPTQILLNNLLYDISEVAIPADNVDHEQMERPRRWDIGFVREFMLFFGPISSIFDFLTFFVMLTIFHAGEQLFQTAWFLESLSTQTLVIFVIRTRTIPFYKSRPSRYLVLGALGVIAFALLLPFSALGRVFRFVPPPSSFLAVLLLFIGAYLALAELLKGWFYRRIDRHTNQSSPAARSVSQPSTLPR